MTISGIFVFDHVELIELRMQEQLGVIEYATVFDVGRVGCFLNPCDVIKLSLIHIYIQAVCTYVCRHTYQECGVAEALAVAMQLR